MTDIKLLWSFNITLVWKSWKTLLLYWMFENYNTVSPRFSSFLIAQEPELLFHWTQKVSTSIAWTWFLWPVADTIRKLSRLPYVQCIVPLRETFKLPSNFKVEKEFLFFYCAYSIDKEFDFTLEVHLWKHLIRCMQQVN